MSLYDGLGIGFEEEAAPTTVNTVDTPKETVCLSLDLGALGTTAQHLLSLSPLTSLSPHLPWSAHQVACPACTCSWLPLQSVWVRVSRGGLYPQLSST